MIRLATETDIPAMLEIYAPYVLQTAYSFEYTVPTVAEFETRFAHHTHCCPWLVWEENGRVLGYAYSAPAFERAAYRWCAEISVYLSPEIHGRGIGRRLYAVLEQLLTLQGYRLVYAIVTSENLDSIAFHRALGYEIRAEFPGCGVKFGRVVGTVWLEKPLKTVEIPAKFPAIWEEVVHSDKKIKNILDNL